GLEPVQPLERPGGGDHPALVHDGHGRQAVAAADLEVVGIMGRGHLDRAGAELGGDVRVGHHRDAPAGRRRLDLPAGRAGGAGGVGGGGGGGGGEHGSRAGGGDHDRVRAVPVPDEDQLSVLVDVLHLDVGQRGEAARAPVDDPFRAVDETVVVQALEDGL